jgi:hypothetical protein
MPATLGRGPFLTGTAGRMLSLWIAFVRDPDGNLIGRMEKKSTAGSGSGI